MHELTKQLERVFNARIICTYISQRPQVDYIGTGHSIINSYVGPTTTSVVLTMYPEVEFSSTILHRFNFTRHAMITTVQHNQRLEGLPGQSTFTVQFIVYDMEGFTNDLNEYCWKYFSEEFNDQLDKVLEKE